MMHNLIDVWSKDIICNALFIYIIMKRERVYLFYATSLLFAIFLSLSEVLMAFSQCCISFEGKELS